MFQLLQCQKTKKAESEVRPKEVPVGVKTKSQLKAAAELREAVKNLNKLSLFQNMVDKQAEGETDANHIRHNIKPTYRIDKITGRLIKIKDEKRHRSHSRNEIEHDGLNPRHVLPQW